MRRRRWRVPALVLGLTAALCLFSVWIERGFDGSGACRVLAVVDGDTVTVHCPNGVGVDRARLMGYDTPELFSPGCVAELWQATRATWELRRILWTADEITLVGQGRDRYGRRLMTAFADDEPVARRMIAAGLARPYGGGRRGGWCG